MWGNLGNFSDLAKAAQELQEHASKAHSGFGTGGFSGGGFFDMDSLRQQEDEKPKPKLKPKQGQEQEQEQTPPPMSQTSSGPSNSAQQSMTTFSKPLASFTKPQVPTPKPPSNIKGKLVIPKANKAATTTTNSTNTLSGNDNDNDKMFAMPSLPPSPNEEAPKPSPESTNGAFQPLSKKWSSTKESTKVNGVETDTNLMVVVPMTNSQDQKEEEQGEPSDVPPAIVAVEPSKDAAETLPSEDAVDEEPFADPEEKSMSTKFSEEQPGAAVDEKMEEPLIQLDNNDSNTPPRETDHAATVVESNNDNVPTGDLLPADGPPPPPDTTEIPAPSKEIDTPNQDTFPETPVAETTSDDQSRSAPQKMYRDGITPAKAASDAVEATKEELSSTMNTVPEHVLEQFSSQMKRLEDNHHMERQSLQQEHQQEVQEMNNQLQKLKQELDQVKGEKYRQKESYNLQINSLKYELEGTQQKLQAKGKEERKLQDAHLKQLRGMEKEMNQKEQANEKLRQDVKEKEKTLEETQEELHNSRDEYATLKERVKAVAGELKERRMECRTLQSEVDSLKDTNNTLNDKITQLEAEGMDMDKSSQETTAELSTLRGQVIDKEKELEKARDAIDAETKKGEDALTAYKKKAQQSLSLANSRTASAVQAKEEAEMEARAARSTADSAMEKASAAELKGKEAMAEAKAYVQEMEQKVAELDDIKAQLDEATTQLERVRLDASSAQESNEQLRCELQSLQGRYEAEQMTNEELRKDLQQSSDRSTELLEEVERLRREGQKLREELKHSKSETAMENDKTMNGSPNGSANADAGKSKRTAEAEATIAMLQQELQDANRAIRELKETLKATVEEQSSNQPPPVQNGGNHNTNSDSTGGMPLFYAMEKQAELTQARNEIARLASLLGDSEASKQEAIDETEETRRQLQDVQSQLERQSQLKSTPEEERVNLEYLKNVILSFLNAKTLAEKKTLLPVIGTVLCLTQQEQRQAMQQLEKDGKLSLDSVTNSVMNLRWS